MCVKPNCTTCVTCPVVRPVSQRSWKRKSANLHRQASPLLFKCDYLQKKGLRPLFFRVKVGVVEVWRQNMMSIISSWRSALVALLASVASTFSLAQAADMPAWEQTLRNAINTSLGGVTQGQLSVDQVNET